MDVFNSSYSVPQQFVNNFSKTKHLSFHIYSLIVTSTLWKIYKALVPAISLVDINMYNKLPHFLLMLM